LTGAPKETVRKKEMKILIGTITTMVEELNIHYGEGRRTRRILFPYNTTM